MNICYVFSGFISGLVLIRFLPKPGGSYVLLWMVQTISPLSVWLSVVCARERCKHFTKAGTTAFDPVSLYLSLGERLPSLSARDVCVARTFSLLFQRFCQRCHVRLSFGILISRHLQLHLCIFCSYTVFNVHSEIDNSYYKRKAQDRHQFCNPIVYSWRNKNHRFQPIEKIVL